MAQPANGWLICELMRGYSPRALTACPRWLEKRLIRLSLVLAFGLFGLHTSLFGLGDLTDRINHRVFSLFSAPFHPATYRESVPIVLVDDFDLRNEKWLWPIAYGNHARVLRALLAHEPHAVFMDFLFVDKREDPSIEELEAVLHTYMEKNIPVFVPIVRGKRVRREIRKLTIPVSTALEAGTLVEDVYGLRDRNRDSAALALFRHACAPEDCEAWQKSLQEAGDRFDRPMQIEWGMVPSASNGFLEGCRYDAGDSSGAVFWKVLRTWIANGLSKAEEICPYMPQVSVGRLLAAQGGGDSQSGVSVLGPGKLLIYGQALKGVSAEVDPPTIHFVSSAYRHAMALENLLLRGADFLKTEIVLPTVGGNAAEKDDAENEPDPPRTVTPGTILNATFFLFAAIHALTSFSSERFLDNKDRPMKRRLLLALVANGFYLSILVTILLVQVIFLRLAPFNLFGLYALIATVRGLTGSFYLNWMETSVARLLLGPSADAFCPRQIGEAQ